MSVYKRPGSPYYQIEFTIKGRRFRRSSETTSKREAEGVERKLKAEEKERAKTRRTDEMNISQGFGRYWLEHGHDLSWAHEVERYIKQILEVIDNKILVSDLCDADVNDFVQQRLQKKGGRYAINRALSVWSAMHNMAGKKWKQKIQSIDWAFHRTKENKREKHLSLEEALRVLDYCPEHLALAVEWSIYTGCRQKETYNLRWSDIDLTEQKATVIKKGGSKHTVWLSSHCINVLDRCPRVSPFVFSKVNRRKLWEAAVKEAGLEGTRWHDLRHTHATFLRQASVPVEVVQRSLGHADITTTMRYAHVADYELREALQKLPLLSTRKTNVIGINSIKSRIKR